MIPVPKFETSKTVAVTGTAASFSFAMIAHSYYHLISSTDFWFKQGTTASFGASPATAGAGSMFWRAGVPLVLTGAAGADVSIIQDTAAGKASLTEIQAY